MWWRYINDYDEDALSTLLEYNKDNAINLKTLKERLLKPSGKAREEEVIYAEKYHQNRVGASAAG